MSNPRATRLDLPVLTTVIASAVFGAAATAQELGQIAADLDHVIEYSPYVLDEYPNQVLICTPPNPPMPGW